MKIIWLVVALALLVLGLYRLIAEAGPARSQPKPTGKGGKAGNKTPGATPKPAPAAKASAPAAKASAPAVQKDASSSKPAPASPRAAQKPAPAPPAQAAPESGKIPKLLEHDPDEDITIITIAPPPHLVAAMNAIATMGGPERSPQTPPAEGSAPARIEQPADEDEDQGEGPGAIPILYDEDASIDEPTRISPLILVSAAAQTDQGRRRRRNEDSMLVLEDHHLYVVADGMGGHAGGDVASKMCVETIGEAFKRGSFAGEPDPNVPRRGAELALAIQMANKAIYEHARSNAAYQGMGTTVVSARFSPNKQRVYFGHVGDSRCYRLRGKQLTQITTDHTMASQGVTGPLANHLNRAVGVQPGVKVDVLIARPAPEDVYLLCSDGLSKMVPDEEIQGILNETPDLQMAVHKLVERANARGGRDNITVVLVQVKDPQGLARYIRDRAAAAN